MAHRRDPFVQHLTSGYVEPMSAQRRPTIARFTHVALPVCDLDDSIAWYERYTPLRLLTRRQDADGVSAWIGQPDMIDKPFIVVLVSMFADQPKGPHPTLAPFAHLGIEVPTREEVDGVAELGRRDGCLVWEPQQLPPPIGYVCALHDPDGNLVEFSFDQGVFAAVHDVWGS
jgi:catechol 2,3-dioxygenase-like lactoylglutathione lyase family enzyme